jgi:hypothetical protein
MYMLQTTKELTITLSGHWGDELSYLYEALSNTEEARSSPVYMEATPLKNKDLFQIVHQPVRTSRIVEFYLVVEYTHFPCFIAEFEKRIIRSK